jgi:putative membrane protein
MKRILTTLSVLSFGAAMTLSTAAQQGSTSQGAAAQEGTGSQGTATSSKQSAGTSNADTMFMKKAAEGGMAEVELGQLAAQKASSDDVKKFGQRMVDDHTKANEQLKQVAAQQHMSLPQEPNAKDKATKARLEKLSGDEFDKAYMKDMVKDHKKDVSEFEHASKSAKDPAVKSFAEQTLPTLKEHLKEAQRIAPKQQQAERTSGQ